MKTLRKLLGLCEHKWLVLREGNLTNSGRIVGHYYDLLCEHCGDIKSKDV